MATPRAPGVQMILLLRVRGELSSDGGSKAAAECETRRVLGRHGPPRTTGLLQDAYDAHHWLELCGGAVDGAVIVLGAAASPRTGVWRFPMSH